MSILVVAENSNKEIKSSTLNSINAASKINDDIHLVVIGNQCEEVAKKAALIEKVKKIIHIDDPQYENIIAESIAPIIVSLSDKYTHILAPASTFGKNLMPRVAALLDLSQISDVIRIENEDTFVRDYMKWIGHSEFGLDYKMIHPSNLLYPNEKEFNHWLEQWYLTYKSVLELSAEHGEFYLIGYESLCNNPKVWINVKDLLGINQESKFLFKESKKVIGQTFDNNLSDKCYRLYESLVSESFGT